MEQVKIILENGIESVVDSIFYLYNLKYYFMYTEKKMDENDYVIFHLVEVGKEIKNTPDGPLDTGYMVGVEINDNNIMQEVITKVVEDKKNGMQNPEIQYLSMSMLSTLKIMTKNTFRLMKNVVEDNFKINMSSDVMSETYSNQNSEQTSVTNLNLPNDTDYVESNQLSPVDENTTSNVFNSDISVVDTEVNKVTSDLEIPTPVVPVSLTDDFTQNLTDILSDVIIDYRSKFFEEQEKNKELQLKIDELTQKLDNIKKVIE